MKKLKITAVIVTRKNSRRVKNKNTRLFHNKDSLLSLKIKQLKKVKEINEIIVGSDDPKAELIANRLKVRFCRREKIFCDEKSTSPNDMIRNMLKFFSSDIVLWAHCTNPFVDEKLYRIAIKTFMRECKKNNHDSLVSLGETRGHFYFNSSPLNHNPLSKEHMLASKLKPVFFQDGSIFMRKFSDMKRDGRFCGKKPFYLKLDSHKTVDINTNFEFKFAKFLSNKIL